MREARGNIKNICLKYVCHGNICQQQPNQTDQTTSSAVAVARAGKTLLKMTALKATTHKSSVQFFNDLSTKVFGSQNKFTIGAETNQWRCGRREVRKKDAHCT